MEIDKEALKESFNSIMNGIEETKEIKKRL